MEKAKILAIGNKVNERTVGDRVFKEREVFLGWQRDGFDGWAPSVRSGISKAGKPYGMASTSVEVSAFGTYVPKAGDIVEVSYNQYGRIVSIVKAE